mmetsp:Transcript_125689/g.250835  ORF Transcript_125689/g.250835 Transcript_125689/m.250835 type:complete len:93 (-) Transcript_125689:144-422(-)
MAGAVAGAAGAGLGNFLGGAAKAKYASSSSSMSVDTGVMGGAAGPFDKRTLGPVFGMWKSLEDGVLKPRQPLAAQGRLIPEQLRDIYHARFL